VTGPPAAVRLTDEQEQAVARRSEPLLLAAGAGSGKTSVLVERFVRAVLEDGLLPGRVLAITFTDRAAGELRERVRRRFLELGEREAARDTEAAFVGTFHSFCARLLRSHALLAGLDPDFAVLDEGVAGQLRERAFAAAALEFQAGAGDPAVDLLAAYGIDQVADMVMGVYAELRSRGERVPRLPSVQPAQSEDDVAAVAACRLLDELLADYGRAYERLKRERGAVDFDDLELCAVELLERRATVRAAWAERFGLLMVDEFQDTNPRQLAMLRALDRGNLFTVGDELQSIYGFRHADVELFRERRRELDRQGQSLALRGNFRSRRAIVAAVNVAFAARMGDRYEELLAARDEPQDAAGPLVEMLLTERTGWDQDPELLVRLGAGLPPVAAWRQAEARLLAQRVAELVRAGEASAGDVAVLLRASSDIDVFERALRLAGLRTLAVVGGFWGRLEVRDVLAYLRTLANPLDETAFYQVLASPVVGLSSDGLALLARAARESGASAWEAACADTAESLRRLQAAERVRLRAFCARARAERGRLRESPLSALVERMLAAGYGEHLRALDTADRRIANVHKLLRLARRFEASEGRDLRAFLEHAARLEAVGPPEPDAPVEGAEPDTVRLMTVHAAKGLEFGVVCVADLGRAPNNRFPRLLVEGERVGLGLVGLDAARARPSLAYEELSERRRRAQEDEEDRILYVAMTRARERLLLSGTVDLARWPLEPTPMGWLAPALGEVGDVIGVLRSGPASVGQVLRLQDEHFAEEPAGEVVPVVPASPEAHVTAPRSAVDITTLSYSSLAELERCGYRYYLERVLGMAEVDVPATAAVEAAGLDPRVRGTIVHSVLEQADLARSQAPTVQEVERVAQSMGIGLAPHEREEIASLLADAWSAAPARRVRNAPRVRREVPFAFPLGGVLITGVIDLLATETEGSVLVLDYKSDRVPADADLPALAEREYGLQRALYGLAALRDGAACVEVVHWFLERPEELVAVRYDADERAGLEARLGGRVRRALEAGFSVSASPHRALCLTCPGRAALCSWAPHDTMREHPDAALRLPFS
jgi:ATP-dependent exoDNAse (exonuclease V) beta subunit